MYNLSDEFKLLLDNGTEEMPLQNFLDKHQKILVGTFNQGAYYSTVFPKFTLADEFTPDFVMIGHRSFYSWDVDLIEIEPAVFDRPLFNKKGQSTWRLRDAETQITNWQSWMKKHRDYFVTKALEKLKEKKAWDDKPKFYNLSYGTYQDITVWYRIIIGRRKDFVEWGNQYRNTKWEESNHRIEIVSWDRLLDKTNFLDTISAEN